MSLGTFPSGPCGVAGSSESQQRRWSCSSRSSSPRLWGVLPGSPSKFEAGDGDMIVTTAGNNDWASVAFTRSKGNYGGVGERRDVVSYQQ
jgi:hypothetical protein